MNPKTDIGKIIQQKLNEKDLTISWLARQICYDESNLCRKIKDNNLSKELIYRISVVLKEELFSYYSEEAKKKW